MSNGNLRQKTMTQVKQRGRTGSEV